MKMHKYNSHIKIRYTCLFICIMSILVIGFFYSKVQGELTNVLLNTEDDVIIIKWDSPDWITCDYVTVQIADDDGIVYKKNVWPLIEKISYRNGEHGKAYTVSVSAHYRDGSVGENIVRKILFLDYDQLPDMPLMIINTYSGNDPTYDEAEKPDNPDNLMGATIVNNEYLPGDMIMIGDKDVSMGVAIRVRGNASSVVYDKKSYKIELDSACDLLGRDEEYSCKEWVLLNNGNNLKTYIGDYVGALCGMEWQPQMMFVNVILNGDWKGCYCLTEAVNFESAHGLVTESGYIFENDAYFWNSDDLYFKTDNQVRMEYPLGYTFKYPDISSVDEKAVWSLQNYMQEFEDRILNGDILYQDYIDEKSYSSWILARDIMGNTDAGGSNMYFYKYDFDENYPTSSKIKMGPLWDFDGAFFTSNDWSHSRAGVISYFPQLFEQDSFSNQYIETWKGISSYLYDDIKMLLDDLEESYGEDIEASWQLESSRWGNEIASFYKQKEQALDWFFKRIIWMNNSLQIPLTESVAIDISDYTYEENSITGHIDKNYVIAEKSYIEGWAFITGKAEYSEYGSIGILVDQKVYLANNCSRIDIQETYELSSDQIGFYIYKELGEGTLCIIDEENKIVYEME